MIGLINKGLDSPFPLVWLRRLFHMSSCPPSVASANVQKPSKNLFVAIESFKLGMYPLNRLDSMLRFVGCTGTLEASADDEKRVRALSDAELCLELNFSESPDLFAFAALKERPHIRFDARYGWRTTTH